MKTIVPMLVAATIAATPAVAADINIWSTTFDTNEYETLGPFPWSSLSTFYGGANFDSAGAIAGFGTQDFRNGTTGTTTFTASGLGTHTGIHLSFDIAFLDSWDGFDGSCCSPDYLDLNFSTGGSYQLSSNNVLGSAPQYGPGTLTAFGYFAANPSWPDAIVHYDLFFTDSSSSFSFSLNANGGGFQGGDDESWAIDNFHLSAITSVPEPASWALMLAGFGLAGSALRRRRPVAA